MDNLPCKIGDKMYGLRFQSNQKWNYKQGVVRAMYYTSEMKLIIVINNLCRGSYGEKIFSTAEEAKSQVDKFNKKVR